VHTAENGEEGIKKATQVIPDLIVTDIMMPVMSGIEMAKAAFVNDTIRHIPIIFLTAKGNPDNQLEGIQLGAIDYLIKPVDIDILKSKIDNHIRIIRLNREKMRNIYLQTTDENIENTVDADFIKKAQKIILKSISDTSFDVSKLASDMALSKIQLHRRFKSVMDVSPGEFIRLTRLKTAYQHLTSGINNVSEIVLMTGFENHSHFTKIVKKQFGKTPQQIITENKNIKT
jgi:YesN/AraC family two-component response regulator